jgi:hypothetical protein
MTIDKYLTAIHLALVDSPVVVDYSVVRQRASSQSGHLRIRINLINGDFLEAAEFFRLTLNGITIADYRHQWMNGERTILHRRWDSTPHYLELENAPYHCHIGGNDTVIPSQPMSIQDVLIAILSAIE